MILESERGRALRVLFVGDDAEGVRLVEAELSRGGFEVRSARVETAGGFAAALRAEPWHLVVSGLRLASFGAVEALTVIHDLGLDLPFIVVSGRVDEQSAVEAMRSGAHDYLNEDNLARLVPAVRRELREADARRVGREAEAALRRRERELDSLARNIPDVLARFDRELRFTFVNSAAELSIGVPTSALLGRTNREVGVTPLDLDAWEATLRRVFESGAPETLEFEYAGPEGARWYVTRLVPELEGGVVETVLSVTRDITARKEAEQRLRIFGEQQAVIAELGKRALSAASPESLLQEGAELIRRTLGVDLIEIVEASGPGDGLRLVAGAGWSEDQVGRLSFPEGNGSVAGYALSQEQSVVVHDLQTDHRFENPDLSLEHGMRSGMSAPMRGREGALGAIGAFAREMRTFSAIELQFLESLADVFARALERASTEAALRASEERFRAIFEAAAEGIVIVDATGQITIANRRAEEIFGLSRSVVAGRPYDDPAWRITDVDGSPVPEEELPFVRVMRDGEPVYGIEHAIEHPSGKRVLLSVSAAPLRNASGTLEGMVASVHDVTARRSDESRIRFQANLLDAIGEAVVATDLGGTITYWNRAAERLYGWTSAEAVGHRVLDRIPGTLRSGDAAEVMARVRAGETWSGEYEAVRRSGEKVPVHVTDSPIYDERDRVAGVLGISADLTEMRKLEVELRQAQKMEAVGRLAGGVAHDFNNILTAIGGCSDFLLADLDPDDPLREDAVAIRAAVDRASALTRQLLAFSRKQISNPRVLDVGGTVRDMTAILRRVIPEDVLVRVDAMPGTMVLADPVEISQVVMNLVVNAVDALESGGRLDIEVARFDGAPLRLPAGGYARISMTDTGSGIDPSVLPHIFEPFFTTKQQGKGTGLGLSTVYGIVTQAGGDVEVTSEPGRGTTFRIYLPLTEESEAALAAGAPHERPRGHGTILLVEDDPAVRGITRRVLERQGYEILEASDPGVALALVPEGGERRVDLLLTDLVMPLMSGPELAQHVGRRIPGVPTLFMSGYTPEEVMQKGIVTPDARFISKPFSHDELVAEVRHAMGGEPGLDGDPGPGGDVLASRTILVVDDDAPLRRVIREGLEPLHCAVLEASTGFEARQALARATADVVVMDLVLPGMEGREAANAILSQNPELPVLFISGYTSHESMRLGGLPTGQAFLRKPFQIQELLEALRHLLGR